MTVRPEHLLESARDTAILIAREEDWMAAFVARDPSAVRSFMTPAFSITTAGWLDAPTNAETWLAHAFDRYVLRSVRFDEFAIRFHGRVAVVQSRCRQRGEEAGVGTPWAMLLRYTDVWVCVGSTWLIDVRHASARPWDGISEGPDPA